MNEFVLDLKEKATEHNPLFMAALGITGAVMFTRTVADAAVAAVTAVIVAVFASAVSGFSERFTGRSGSHIVFFASAAAAMSACGALTSALLPSVWEDIGPCFPLFAAGSLISAATQRSGDVSKRVLSSTALALGYDAALVLVAVVRQLASLVFHAFETSGGALLIAGLLAASARAAVEYIKSRPGKEAPAGGFAADHADGADTDFILESGGAEEALDPDVKAADREALDAASVGTGGTETAEVVPDDTRSPIMIEQNADAEKDDVIDVIIEKNDDTGEGDVLLREFISQIEDGAETDTPSVEEETINDALSEAGRELFLDVSPDGGTDLGESDNK